MTFYNLRSNPPGDLPYQIIKFDDALNPESVYNVGKTVCECPAGVRLTCRHRQMLPKLIERVDTAWFLCFETMEWEDPTGNAAEHDEVAEHDAATGGLSEPQFPILEEGTEPADPAPQAVSQHPAPQVEPKAGWRRF